MITGETISDDQIRALREARRDDPSTWSACCVALGGGDPTREAIAAARATCAGMINAAARATADRELHLQRLGELRHELEVRGLAWALAERNANQRRDELHRAHPREQATKQAALTEMARASAHLEDTLEALREVARRLLAELERGAK